MDKIKKSKRKRKSINWIKLPPESDWIGLHPPLGRMFNSPALDCVPADGCIRGLD